MRKYKILIEQIIVLVIFQLLLLSACAQNKYPEELRECFEIMDKATIENNFDAYLKAMDKIIEYPKIKKSRDALLYYFFEYKNRNETFLNYIQADVKRLGFYEDWDVLDRFYKRYQERYSWEAEGKDSSLMSVHQAYIQFLAVCNYEKIKPVYLRELCETILEGDYTYTFNSYLLPEHWEEAADTLMKYYWQVKDEDTRIKMNEAIVKMKMKKAKNHYIAVCERDTDKVIDRMFTWLDLDKQLAYEILEYVKNEKLKFILKTYLQY